MGEYAVFGASKATGSPVLLLVTAGSDLEAREIAAANGVRVSRVSTQVRDIEQAREHRTRQEADRRAAAEVAAEEARRRAEFEASVRPPPPLRQPKQTVWITWSLWRDVNLVGVIVLGVCLGMMLFTCVGAGIVASLMRGGDSPP